MSYSTRLNLNMGFFVANRFPADNCIEGQFHFLCTDAYHATMRNNMQPKVNWQRIEEIQAELAVIASRHGKGFAPLEAASDAVFFFVNHPDSKAAPSGVFRNCLRNLQRTLLH